MCRKDGLSCQFETVCLPFRKACFFQLVRNSSCFWYLLPALNIFLCKLSDQLFWTCALLSILCIRLNSDHYYTTVHVVDELSIAISWARGRCRSFPGLCYIYWPMLSGQPGLDSFSQSCSMTSECSIRFHIKKSSVTQFASSHLGNVDEVISCVDITSRFANWNKSWAFLWNRWKWQDEQSSV